MKRKNSQMVNASSCQNIEDIQPFKCSYKKGQVA